MLKDAVIITFLFIISISSLIVALNSALELNIIKRKLEHFDIALKTLNGRINLMTTGINNKGKIDSKLIESILNNQEVHNDTMVRSLEYIVEHMR